MIGDRYSVDRVLIVVIVTEYHTTVIQTGTVF